jgi:putative protease
VPLYRNRDQAFERALEKISAERRMPLTMTLQADATGLQLTLVDADGISASVHRTVAIAPARDAEKALVTLREALGQLGNTDFFAADIAIGGPYFVPASLLKTLRREGIAALIAAREAQRRRLPRAAPVTPPTAYPEPALSFLGNVLNRHARAFYEKHGVTLIADAYEAGAYEAGTNEVSLMITKHCLRYSYNLCPKEAKDWQLKGVKAEPMTLVNGDERLTLRFDCKACEMHVVGKAKKPYRVIPLAPLTPLHAGLVVT